ncbi:hypothetical protein AO843_17940 [Lysinibacillus sp. ZYM-1]|nr:hypothetical protein AO843_17940 [Lysinibacillus sp. ZYM-1]
MQKYVYQFFIFIKLSFISFSGKKKEPKESSLKHYKFACGMNFLIFFATIPVAFIMGVLGNDSGDYGMISFLLSFSFISGLPFLFFIWSLRDFLILHKEAANRYLD